MPLPGEFPAAASVGQRRDDDPRRDCCCPGRALRSRCATMTAEYYRYISYLDAQIGRVLDALDASPHAKNTHHRLRRRLRRGPRQPRTHRQTEPLRALDARAARSSPGPGIRGRPDRTDAMCYLFDVMPTLGKLCGVAGPTTSEGIDLTATLRDPSRRRHAVDDVRLSQRSAGLRDERWKLIRYPASRPRRSSSISTRIPTSWPISPIIPNTPRASPR